MSCTLVLFVNYIHNFCTGISVDTLAAEFESRYRVIEDSHCKNPDTVIREDGFIDSSVEQIGPEDSKIVAENCSEDEGILLSVPSKDGNDADEDSGDIELGDMFLEDSSSGLVLHPEIVEMQKKEKMKELTSEKNLEKLEGIWKKVNIALI